MGLPELFIIAVGLSMDAFAASVCKGLAMQRMNRKQALIIGAFFGGFQAAMPLLGYFLGIQFSDKIEAFDHWIAAGLLAVIGVNMIREAFSKDEKPDTGFSIKGILVLAVATSIDALAVGVSFAFLRVNILTAVVFIGVTTFAISVAGVKIGNLFGNKYKRKAEIAGGTILIAIGVKILLEHLGVIG